MSLRFALAGLSKPAAAAVAALSRLIRRGEAVAPPEMSSKDQPGGIAVRSQMKESSPFCKQFAAKVFKIAWFFFSLKAAEYFLRH